MADSDFRASLARIVPVVRLNMKVGGTIQSAERDSLNGFHFDFLTAEPRFSGRFAPWLGWQASFIGNVGTFGPSGFHTRDVVVQFDIHDAFHIWGGRLLVPFDRANLSGPYFMDAWNLPGVYGGKFLVGANTGAFGRNTGAVVWGQFLDGRLKYHVGAFGFEAATATPKLAARVNIDIVGQEPDFAHSSTYYGSQNILAIGGGFEYRKDGETFTPAAPKTETCTPKEGAPAGTLSCIPDVSATTVLGDLAIGVVDILAERKFGDAGVGTLEGAYYHYDSHYTVKNAYFATASYLLPWEIGPGKLLPSVRFQQAFGQDNATDNQIRGSVPPRQQNIVDVFLTYVVQKYDLRFSLGYQRQELGVGPARDAIQFGARIQK